MDVHHGGEDTLLESQPAVSESSLCRFLIVIVKISIVFLLRIQVQDRAGYKTDFKLDLRIG